ncbi:hypothetical protein SUDANB105_04040 [Streptomyces sp. enrichment culture]|uniref:DUF461 domain-containing protein n=1 Tax=Streptomyces sp. enrichment culture TaxID=1795815 RepID=UPI003F548C13
MSSSLRRGALAASVTALSIASLAACGAGNNAQTLEIKPDNAATSVGDIKIQNAVVIVQPDAESTGPAVVSATVFNDGDTAETLESITLDGISQPVELTPAGGKGELTIPADGSVVIGGKDNAGAVVSNGQALEDGAAHKVTFTFSETGDVSLEAFVVPAEGYFEEWGPTKVPAAPAATPSGEATPSGAAGDHAAEGAEGAESTPSGAAGETGAATAGATAGETAEHDAAGH